MSGSRNKRLQPRKLSPVCCSPTIHPSRRELLVVVSTRLPEHARRSSVDVCLCRFRVELTARALSPAPRARGFRLRPAVASIAYLECCMILARVARYAASIASLADARELMADVAPISHWPAAGRKIASPGSKLMTAPVHDDAAQRSVSHRHHLHSHVAMLALPCRCHGPVLSQDHRLGGPTDDPCGARSWAWQSCSTQLAA